MDLKTRIIFHEIYHDKCQYCGTKLNGTGQIDHIVPKVNGGKDSLGNYTLACQDCNLRKSGSDIPEPYIGLLLAVADRNKDRIKNRIQNDKIDNKKHKSTHKKDNHEKLLCNKDSVLDELKIHLSNLEKVGRKGFKAYTLDGEEVRDVTLDEFRSELSYLKNGPQICDKNIELEIPENICALSV